MKFCPFQFFTAIALGMLFMNPGIEAQYRSDVSEMIRNTTAQKKELSPGRLSKEELANSMRAADQLIWERARRKLNGLKAINNEESSRSANLMIMGKTTKEVLLNGNKVKVNVRTKRPPDEISIRNGRRILELVTDNSTRRKPVGKNNKLASELSG